MISVPVIARVARRLLRGSRIAGIDPDVAPLVHEGPGVGRPVVLYRGGVRLTTNEVLLAASMRWVRAVYRDRAIPLCAFVWADPTRWDGIRSFAVWLVVTAMVAEAVHRRGPGVLPRLARAPTLAAQHDSVWGAAELLSAHALEFRVPESMRRGAEHDLVILTRGG